MRCESCPLERTAHDAPPLAAFLEQLSCCDECPLLADEAASPLVRLLVDRHREAARVVRGLENQVRKLKNELREASTEADKFEQRLAVLERLQKTSTQETDEALREQIELVRRQRSAMLAMSAPIIRVWKRVLVLPIIGALDAARAASITDRMLVEVQSTRSTYAIVDLTGLDEVDAATADHLIKMVRAVSLLGGRVVFTGIQSMVAQTFVAIGVDLSSVTTLSTLEEALRRIV